MMPNFRTWDTEEQKMFYLELTDEGIGLEVWFNFSGIGAMHDDKRKGSEGYVLMQSTGIKDHNGREIFEGDILKLGKENPWYGHVEYFSQWDYPAFDVRMKERYYDKNVISHELRFGRVEVVGNIYENPVYSTEDGII